MADFTVTIEDADQLAGIAWARARYNDAHPEAPIESDGAYVQFVMAGAAASYVIQQAARRE